jgi:hypothetical protein
MGKLHRITREYPTNNGIPVPFHEIDLPMSQLDLTKQESMNNHHGAYTAHMFGRLAISQTFRDLNCFQDVTPKDVHAITHDRFEPPTHLPDLITMLDIIDEQRLQNGLLRYGSAHHPTYKGITQELWHTLMEEYNNVA